MDLNNRQILALVLAGVLILNMTLFALRKLNEIVFWAVLGGVAILWFVLKSMWK